MASVDPVAIAIKQIIMEKGLVQRAVAERAGFSKAQFSSMLNDRKIIRACDMFPISVALGVSIADIYKTGANAAPPAQ